MPWQNTKKESQAFKKYPPISAQKAAGILLPFLCVAATPGIILKSWHCAEKALSIRIVL